MKLIAILALLPLAACVKSSAPAAERPMDEVPVQQTLSGGAREYSFANGCVVVLQSDRAVLISESALCELHHRDIALLYASAD
jgi:hypothetical protein